MEKKFMSPALKGVFIAIALILVGEVIKLSGQEQNKALSLISYAILAGGLIWAAISYANERDNYVTFGQTFAHSFKALAATIAIIAVYTFISVKFIDPGVVDRSVEAARTEMEKNNALSEEQIETALSMTRNYFMAFLMGGIIIGFGILGAIFCAIGAAIAKKKPVDPFQQNVNPAQPL